MLRFSQLVQSYAVRRFKGNKPLKGYSSYFLPSYTKVSFRYVRFNFINFFQLSLVQIQFCDILSSGLKVIRQKL